MTENQLAREIGDNLKSIMDEYGISQKELSELTGISRPMISKYISGDFIPTLKNIINIAYILECDLTELVDADEMID